ncbi:MAG: M20/M25/M40 family metallo-hydrolase [Ignavibacteriales bacterium]
MREKIHNVLEERSSRIHETWRALHAMPEPGFEERRTSEYLAERLRQSGYAVETGLGGTSVVGTLRSQRAGPVLGIRAEMDALRHEINGKVEVRHSCGHDANCAMVTAVAEAIAAVGGIRRGTLKIVFQPAEGMLCGANRNFGRG